ncbi:MAG: alpha/beta fold hydrolase, partial [Myxococcota bacterium]
PLLFCFPSLAAPTGPIQYARFAAALQGQREVWVFPHEGYGTGEALPPDAATVVAKHADAVIECAAGRPFVIAGVSSGGYVSYDVTRELERRGVAPAATVVIDTYLPHQMPAGFTYALQRAWIESNPDIPRLGDELTGMVWYFDLYARWEPQPITTPLLYVRVKEPIPGVDGAPTAADGEDWRFYWQHPHVLREIPGHHLEMMGENATTTAMAVHEFIADDLGKLDGHGDPSSQ